MFHQSSIQIMMKVTSPEYTAEEQYMVKQLLQDSRGCKPNQMHLISKEV